MIKNIALGLLALALAASCTEKKETERKVFAKNEFKECMGHRTKRILRVGRKRHQTY